MARRQPGREARGYIGKLFSAQAVRARREATLVGADSAAMTEHCVYGSLTAAWAALPPSRNARGTGLGGGVAGVAGAGAAGSGTW